MPINKNPRDRAFRTRVERQKRRNEIAKILEYRKEEVEKRCRIHHLGIGYKITNGKLSESIGVLAFVQKKLKDRELQGEKIELIENVIKDVTTDVIEIPDGIQPTSGVINFEKIKGGIPTRHYKKSGSGTLGIVVKKIRKPKPFTSGNKEFLKTIKYVALEFSAKLNFYNEFLKTIQYYLLEGKIKNSIIPLSAKNVVENPKSCQTLVNSWINGIKSDEEFLIELDKMITSGVIKLPVIPEYLYALTNFHVGAAEPLVGSSLSVKKGDVWTFPGLIGEQSSPKGSVAKFIEGKPIIPNNQSSFNYYDVALAKISDNWRNDVIPYEMIDGRKVKGMEDAEIGDEVIKYGKSSNFTVGTVAGIIPYPQTVSINYNGKSCDFTNQLIIVGEPTSKPFSKSGDSGSLVVSKEVTNGGHVALALLFSGATTSDSIYYSFASPIKKIAEDFQLDFNP